MSSPETSHLVTRTQPLSSDSLLCYRLRGRKSRKLRARERIKKTFCLFCFAEGWEKVSTLELVHYLVSGIASRFSQSVSAWLSASGSAHHHHLLRGALWFLSFSLAMVWVPLLFSLLYIYFWLLKLNIHTEPIDCCLVKEKGVKLFVCFFLWLLGGGWEKITKGALFAFDSEAGFFFCKLVESPIVASLMVVVVAVLVDFLLVIFCYWLFFMIWETILTCDPNSLSFILLHFIAFGLFHTVPQPFVSILGTHSREGERFAGQHARNTQQFDKFGKMLFAHSHRQTEDRSNREF